MKAKIHAIGIIDYGTVPHAVVAADVRVNGQRHRYVLLTDTQRAALSSMVGEYGRYAGYVAVASATQGAPALVRAHMWSVDGTSDGTPLHARAGTWANAETLWVHVTLAGPAYTDLEAWRERNPRRDGCIWAPNWNARTAVQALCLAAGNMDAVRSVTEAPIKGVV